MFSVLGLCRQKIIDRTSLVCGSILSLMFLEFVWMSLLKKCVFKNSPIRVLIVNFYSFGSKVQAPP